MNFKSQSIPVSQNSPEPPSSKRPRHEDGHGNPQRERSHHHHHYRVRKLHASERCETNDEVHSTIEICPVMRAILGTRAMQRLRDIKQLARADHVYMNAEHNRFEHSLGVAKLAHDLCDHIRKTQPKLGVTEKDVLCVKLAGLLHDIGHGPYSHTYENFVKMMPEYLDSHPDLKKHYVDVPSLPNGWRHEMVSLMMIDNVLQSLGLAIDLLNLDEPLKQIGDGVDRMSVKVFKTFTDDGDDNEGSIDVLTSRDFVFIKECIWGGPLPEIKEILDIEMFVGRPWIEKDWMYDIVCNSDSGLDVDKIDYYARDQRRAFRGSGEPEIRMIKQALVTWGRCTKRAGMCPRCLHRPNPTLYPANRHLTLCYPEKMQVVCLKFFEERKKLHSTIYKHKTVCAAKHVVVDILCKADPFYRISTGRWRSPVAKPTPWESLPISRAMMDPYAFLQLDDTIISLILHSNDPRLQESQDLIVNRLQSRSLYKLAGEMVLDEPALRRIGHRSESEIADEIFRINGEYDHDGTKVKLRKDDFIVEKLNINFGSRDKNPLLRMNFVSKEKTLQLGRSIAGLPEADAPKQNVLALDEPKFFEKNVIRVYCRSPDPGIVGCLEHHFSTWKFEAADEAVATPADKHDDAQFVAGDAILLTQNSDDEDYNTNMIDLQSSPQSRFKNDDNYD